MDVGMLFISVPGGTSAVFTARLEGYPSSTSRGLRVVRRDAIVTSNVAPASVSTTVGMEVTTTSASGDGQRDRAVRLALVSLPVSLRRGSRRFRAKAKDAFWCRPRAIAARAVVTYALIRHVGEGRELYGPSLLLFIARGMALACKPKLRLGFRTRSASTDAGGLTTGRTCGAILDGGFRPPSRKGSPGGIDADLVRR